MKITASSYHDLAHIANLLEDHHYITKRVADAFDTNDAPTEIVIHKDTEEVVQLLKDNLGSVKYPYTTYSTSETTVGKRRKAQRGKRSDGQGSSSL